MIADDRDEPDLQAVSPTANEGAPGQPGALPPCHDDTLRLKHELQVHQVELEASNTELRQALLALEVSRDRFADLFENAPVGYVTLNADGLVDAINEFALGMVGLDRAQILNRRFSTFVQADDRPRWVSLCLGLKRYESTEGLELWMTGRGGTTLRARLDCRLDPAGRDGAGRPRLLVVVQDVTERAAAEKALAVRYAEIERFNSVAVGRELEMIRIKQEVNALSLQLGRAAPYELRFLDATRRDPS